MNGSRSESRMYQRCGAEMKKTARLVFRFLNSQGKETRTLPNQICVQFMDGLLDISSPQV